MARITVQRQCWQRWPRVLIAERRNDDGTVDERRYVPEGGTENEWKAMCRKLTARMDALMNERDERANDSYEARRERDRKQAEIDGLQWQVDELESALRRACECSADVDRAECWRRYFESKERDTGCDVK